MRYIRVVTFQQGHYVYNKGEHPKEIFAVAQGALEYVRQSKVLNKNISNDHPCNRNPLFRLEDRPFIKVEALQSAGEECSFSDQNASAKFSVRVSSKTCKLYIIPKLIILANSVSKEERNEIETIGVKKAKWLESNAPYFEGLENIVQEITARELEQRIQDKLLLTRKVKAFESVLGAFKRVKKDDAMKYPSSVRSTTKQHPFKIIPPQPEGNNSILSSMRKTGVRQKRTFMLTRPQSFKSFAPEKNKTKLTIKRCESSMREKESNHLLSETQLKRKRFLKHYLSIKVSKEIPKEAKIDSLSFTSRALSKLKDRSNLSKPCLRGRLLTLTNKISFTGSIISKNSKGSFAHNASTTNEKAKNQLKLSYSKKLQNLVKRKISRTEGSQEVEQKDIVKAFVMHVGVSKFGFRITT